MQIISHRGYWLEENEKNTMKAFLHSFSLGFGTETDIRDLNGELVISHDMATEGCLTADVFFEAYNRFDEKTPLALNIKSDGLQKPLLELLGKYAIDNYFLFDMSVPDLRVSVNMGFKTYSRLSEFEADLPFYEQVQGIWLDAFTNTWYDKDLIETHRSNEKQVCIVSADLHKRDHRAHWQQLKEMGAAGWDNNIILCTDFPEHAKSFFDNE